MARKKAPGLSNKELLELARLAVPGVETLQPRQSDRRNFYEVSVQSLGDALRTAYERGLQKGARQ
jgi:hypothetical protein